MGLGKRPGRHDDVTHRLPPPDTPARPDAPRPRGAVPAGQHQPRSAVPAGQHQPLAPRAAVPRTRSRRGSASRGAPGRPGAAAEPQTGRTSRGRGLCPGAGIPGWGRTPAGIGAAGSRS